MLVFFESRRNELVLTTLGIREFTFVFDEDFDIEGAQEWLRDNDIPSRIEICFSTPRTFGTFCVLYMECTEECYTIFLLRWV